VIKPLLLIVCLGLLSHAVAETPLPTYIPPEPNTPPLRRLFDSLPSKRALTLPRAAQVRHFSLTFVRGFCGYSAGFPAYLHCDAQQREPPNDVVMVFARGKRGEFELDDIAQYHNRRDPFAPQLALQEPEKLIPLATRQVSWSITNQPTLYWYIDKPWHNQVRFILRRHAQDEYDIVLNAAGQQVKKGINPIDLRQYNISLRPEVEYNWFIALVRDENYLEDATVAQGAIKYVPKQFNVQNLMQLQKVNFYAKQGFWYDAIAIVAANLEQAAFQRQWRALLKDELPMLVEYRPS